MPQRPFPHPASPAAARPSPVQETLEQAALALRAQDFAGAARLAEGVLKSNWGNAQAAQLLGQALLLGGRPAEAVEPLTRAARRSRDPVIETLLARALATLGRAEEAAAHLRAAIERRPAYPIAFLELGETFSQARRFDEAIDILGQGLAACPGAAVLRVALAHAHLGRGDRAEARRLFEAVRAAEPGRRDVLVGLAGVLSLDGEPAAAAELYRAALAARPDDAAVRIGLARCLLELGDRAAGEAALREAVDAAPPTQIMALRNLAMTTLATAPHGRLFLRPSAAARFLDLG